MEFFSFSSNRVEFKAEGFWVQVRRRESRLKSVIFPFPGPRSIGKIARGCEVAAPVRRRRRRCALAGPPNWAALRLSHTHARTHARSLARSLARPPVTRLWTMALTGFCRVINCRCRPDMSVYTPALRRYLCPFRRGYFFPFSPSVNSSSIDDFSKILERICRICSIINSLPFDPRSSFHGIYVIFPRCSWTEYMYVLLYRVSILIPLIRFPRSFDKYIYIRNECIVDLPRS